MWLNVNGIHHSSAPGWAFLSLGVVSVPKGKIVALQAQLEEVLPRNQLSAKCLASLTGKVISMSWPSGQTNDKGVCTVYPD